jgi:hypothetical protein
MRGAGMLDPPQMGRHPALGGRRERSTSPGGPGPREVTEGDARPPSRPSTPKPRRHSTTAARSSSHGARDRRSSVSAMAFGRWKCGCDYRSGRVRRMDPIHVEKALRAIQRPRLELTLEVGLHLEQLLTELVTPTMLARNEAPSPNSRWWCARGELEPSTRYREGPRCGPPSSLYPDERRISWKRWAVHRGW